MSECKLDHIIGSEVQASQISRRRFLEFCATLLVTAPRGLALTHKASASEVAERIQRSKRPSVIWLHFQDCTGCTESLLNTSQPDIAELIFNIISLDYHETLMAASGYQSEAALRQASESNSGQFVLVVEGSIPTKEQGRYMQVAGRPALELLHEIGSKSAFVLAIGSCASWGGIASADPNPTGALGVDAILKDKTVINLPGCPPNPYNFLSVVLEHAAMHRLPALDRYHRPKFAYDRLIHDHCPRRGHFDAGRFARTLGDDGHRQGWCLYPLGCKGPVTHAACSTRPFNEVPDLWPVGIGAPCIGCTESATAFRIPVAQLVAIHGTTPPDTFPVIGAPSGSMKIGSAAVLGVIAGSVGTAMAVASRRLPRGEIRSTPPKHENRNVPETNSDSKEI